MLYPDKLIEVQEGLSLYIPDPELVRPTYEHLVSRDAATAFPFWANIWPAAIAMGNFLKQEPQWVEGKKVLELGAGIGLPSFMMSRYAAGMIISDHSKEAVALIEKNIRHLQLPQVSAMCIDWNHFPENIQADIVLLSDINYAPAQFSSLQSLIKSLLLQGVTVILSTPQRITAAPFAEALQPYVKQAVLQSVDEMNRMVDIRILVLSI